MMTTTNGKPPVNPHIGRWNQSVRLISIAATAFATLALSASSGEPKFAEFSIANPPGYPHGSTHEFTFGKHGDLWITQQNQARLIHLRNGKLTAFVLGKPGPQGPGPHGIEVDHDGNLWLTFQFTNRIVKVSPEGKILAEYPIPTKTVANPGPHGLTVASDGDVWWTGKEGGVIGKLDPKTAHFSLYQLRNPASQPIYISEASDHNLWFTELTNNAIGRITPAGKITEITLPGTNSRPIAILEGPDRKMWFTMEHGHGFGTVDRDGHGLKTYRANPPTAEPAGLAFDRYGHPWLQYMTPDMIGRIHPDMSVTPYCIHPSCNAPPSAVMHRIHLGPDNRLWFTELGLDRIGKIVSGY